MAVPRLTDDLDIIQKLSDNPNDTDGLSAAELKARFDAAVNIIKVFINRDLGSALDSIEENAAKLEGKTISNVLGADNSTIPTSAAVRASMSAAGMGDMASATYDVNGRRTDIFDYADGAVSAHNLSTEAHNDMRLLLQDISERINAVLDSDDETLDELSEIVAYIKSNKDLLDAVTAAKVSVVDIVNNLTTNVASKPLSAAQGVALKALIDAVRPISGGGTGASTRAGAAEGILYMGSNPIASIDGDTTSAWGALGTGYAWFDTAGLLNNQPARWGIIVSFCMSWGEVFQIWKGTANTPMYVRSGNAASGWLMPFTPIFNGSTAMILKEGVHYGESGTEPANPVEGQFYGILV